MRRTTVFSVLVLATLLCCSAAVQPVHSSVSGTIYIKPNGTIAPSTAPIHRAGETYTLTGNIKNQLVVEADNIVLDGSGYTLQGGGGGVALNLTCSNVTVEDFNMVNWQAGVLGVFNNNTVKNCLITGCQSGFKIYAQYYDIVGNTIERNGEGIRIGQGGLNFIAGNDITNNAVGLYLFDSGNVIVQNNISKCNYSAITLDATGWSQTVYHNNFVDNYQNLVDYTIPSTSRPVQSAVPAWDNGSSGNYWSSYTGADADGDGIGDSPYSITHYSPNSFQAFYNYVDRYPLETPFNIEAQIPPVPAALTPTLANGQAGALSFLRNVLQLNLDKYKVALSQDYKVPSDAGYQTEYILYQLHGSKSSASVEFQISNSTVTNCHIDNVVGKLYFAFPFTDNYNATKRMMENYQAWKNDPEVGRMLSLLNKAGSAGNAMIISGNMDLKMADTGDSSEFDWSYTYNGADYSGVSLRFDDYIPSLTFSDNRGIYSVGDTAINTSKQQAIEIAENYVFENVSYSYIFANGTKTTIKSLMGNESDATASLETTARTLSTLYPYWNVQVPLKQGYPAAIESMTVWVWADSGEVFGSNYGPINTSPYPFSVSSLVFFEALLIVIVAAAMIAAAALIVVSRSKPKQNVNQPSTHWILKCKASEEKNLT